MVAGRSADEAFGEDAVAVVHLPAVVGVVGALVGRHHAGVGRHRVHVQLARVVAVEGGAYAGGRSPGLQETGGGEDGVGVGVDVATTPVRGPCRGQELHRALG